MAPKATPAAHKTAVAPVRRVPDLTFQLKHIAHVLTTELTAALAEIDSSPRLHCVLAHALTGKLTQAQVAELADLDKTTMVVTMDELEKAGLAERRPSSTDRRARIISVTEAGVQHIADGLVIIDRIHSEVLGTLPEDERKVFASAVQRLTEGRLSTPIESPRPVRRAREARIR
ncbi:MarR family winged helix-turn-helix transcriptional regulator [Streptomyces sp. H10-C2]|uniref:MarR family winged helix-turn-helix transcriptional regulator n=1 Tax=unclassified Streptomyces TaxID=2593676 RepID=UPI0024B9FD51|nr:MULTISPECIES: MarR family winged helix-turn-helix transcriptional regulator [unclassified Streptomyces]MDJ0344973.1 MarR family winged helix-turn-helix transcriptional regulator [Streptomyces sp. PH10-H1]MDJ0373946.1 MarR family winged helix-turn-helix transcriptional regulator [Streptomyces sp. H10-C2]